MLQNMKCLQSFKVGSSKLGNSLTNYHQISRQKSCLFLILEFLSTRDAPKLRNICSPKMCASSLVSLELFNCSSLDYLGLGSLRLLQYLIIKGCKNLYRLEGLEKLDSLKHLIVRDCVELASLFGGVIRGEDADTPFLVNLSQVHFSHCPKLTDKFGIMNLQSSKLAGTKKIHKYEFVEDVLVRWNEFFTMLEERERSVYTLTQNILMERWMREIMVGALSQPQTIAVLPCDIPCYHIYVTLFQETNYDLCWDDYSSESIYCFLKMIMVALCWGSEAQRSNITKMIQANKDTMYRYLLGVSTTTLRKCLIYLWCHCQIPSFLIILQILRMEGRCMEEIIGQPSYLSKNLQHEILWLTVVCIIEPRCFLHFKITTICEDIVKSGLIETGLPVLAKHVMLTWLNQDGIQIYFERSQGLHELEQLKSLLHIIPSCYIDLECLLNSSKNDSSFKYYDDKDDAYDDA